jgi:hypothetical protein
MKLASKILKYFIPICTLAIFFCIPVSANTTGKLYQHTGYVVLGSESMQAYNDAALTDPISHYIISGDWVDTVSVNGTSAYITYPVNIADGSGDTTHTHYISYSQYHSNVDGGTGTFKQGWDSTKWYTEIQTLSYTDDHTNNQSILYVLNNPGGNGYTLSSGASNHVSNLKTPGGSNIAVSSLSRYPTYASTDTEHSDYTWSLTAQAWSTANLIQGENTVEGIGVDASGNYSVANFTFKYDTVAPTKDNCSITNDTSTSFTANIVGPNDATSGVASVQILGWSQSDKSDKITVSASNSGGTYSATIKYSKFTSSSNVTVHGLITDNAGNTYEFPITGSSSSSSSPSSDDEDDTSSTTSGGGGTIIVNPSGPPPDTTPPSVTFNPNSCSWRNTSIDVKITVTDPAGGGGAIVSGVGGFIFYGYNTLGNYAPSGGGGSGGTTTVVSGEGITQLYAVAWDNAGNTATASSGYYQIDYTPVVITDSVDQDLVTKKSNSVDLILTDSLSGVYSYSVQVSYNNGFTWVQYSTGTPNGSASTAVPISFIHTGANRAKIEVYDVAGNYSEFETGIFLVDANPPYMSLVNKVDYYNSTSLTFSTHARWNPNTDEVVKFGDSGITTADDAELKGIYTGLTLEFSVTCPESYVTLEGTVTLAGSVSGSHTFPLHFLSIDGSTSYTVTSNTQTLKAYTYVSAAYFDTTEKMYVYSELRDYIPSWTPSALSVMDYDHDYFNVDATAPLSGSIVYSSSNNVLTVNNLSDVGSRVKYVLYSYAKTNSDNWSNVATIAVPKGVTTVTLPNIKAAGEYTVEYAAYDAVINNSVNSGKFTVVGNTSPASEVISEYTNAYYIGIRHPTNDSVANAVFNFLNDTE